jgi:hypothetical protein
MLMAGILLPRPSLAFDAPLSDHAVREAYFLGQRSDEKPNEFLNEYSHSLPFPKTGPFVSEIQVLTPYAQVVEVSSQRHIGYSAQQAWQDYRERGDFLRVRVRIELTVTYSEVAEQKPGSNASSGNSYILRPLDFHKDFEYSVKQGEKEFEPFAVEAAPFFGDDGTVLGDYVWLKYAAEDFDSSEVTVEVSTPDGQHVHTTLDLGHLR